MRTTALLCTFGLLAIAAIGLGPMGLAAAEEQEQAAVDSAAQFGRGAGAWSENCGRCHNFRDPKEFEDYEWDVIVNHMRVRANLPGDMAMDIKAFLKASN